MKKIVLFLDKRRFSEASFRDGVIVGFTGIFPSRNPDDTDSLLVAVEQAIASGGSSVNFYNREVTWSLRE